MAHEPRADPQVDPLVAARVDSEVRRAVGRYETALGTDDVAALDDLFVDAPQTLRADAQGVLVGHERISAFRRGRGGAPAREVSALHVVVHAEDVATAVAQTLRPDGTRGLQTQVWVRGDDAWRVAVAHVSSGSPPAAPADPPRGATGTGVDDVATWRVVGGPLVAPTGSGPLDGLTIAVKDVVAVAGQRVGHGNPVLLEQALPEPHHAAALSRLLAAGAGVRGIARTDELAFSLSGTNVHYGSPRNPWGVGRVVGGSTSGPASAVARGLADLGLGTDTAGSIRIPASYCGLHGLRTTHGAVPTSGVDVLAPSFDTVGLLARDASVLHRAATALLPGCEGSGTTGLLLVDPGLESLADPDVGALSRRAARDLASSTGTATETREVVDLDELAGWCDAFRLVQAAEAWEAHGAWVGSHPGVLGPGVAARFAAGAAAPPGEVAQARGLLRSAAAHLRTALVPGTVLALPATSTPAPAVLAGRGEKERLRSSTLRLTCLASIAGLPAAVAPAGTVEGLPAGLCLLGAPGSDLVLTDLLARWAPERSAGVEDPRSTLGAMDTQA